MRKDEFLSRLIGSIYDAALDPVLWPSALSDIAGFVGGSGAGLLARDAVHRTGNIYYQAGADPRFTQLYFDEYIKFDPLSAAYLVVDVGEVFSNSMVVPESEFTSSRFYKEWVQPQGWVDNICVTLDKSADSHAGLVVFRHERDGLANKTARDRMQLLVPHVRRAVAIGKVIELKTSQGAGLADALDGIGAGMFLVDASAHIVHANAAGNAMLAAHDILRQAGGRLIATDRQVDCTLRAIFLAAGKGDMTIGVKGIDVPLIGRNGEHSVAHVLPLNSGARRQAGIAYSAAAALFVHKAALASPSPLEAIAKTYRLTPTELRVLLAIVEVGGAPAVAAALGIGETTVKTHLGRLYCKTGVHRHADLVKLVAGYSTPLHG